MSQSMVFDAIVRAAVEVTGAARGWLIEREGTELRVAASIGPGTADVVGSLVKPDGGSVAFVVQSGQPLALTARPGDPMAAEGVAASLGSAPSTVLCVPCTAGDDVVGALEVVDKTGAFTVDDLELVTLLGEIAGAALVAIDERAGVVPEPAELGAEINHLAVVDPDRYRLVAAVLRDLLSRG